MGGGTYTKSAFTRYASTRGITENTKTEEIYKNGGLVSWMDPRHIKVRESCDSEDNPESTPTILGLDVTGSMSPILQNIGTVGLSSTVLSIHDNKIIKNPHVMIIGIGDAACDSAPLQATQFEADIRINEQLTEIYFEQGGGGNGSESYNLAWHFAHYKTKIDSIIKRNKKGYIITIGDDNVSDSITDREIQRIYGTESELKGFKTSELLTKVRENYEVHHIVVKPLYSSIYPNWVKVLGENYVHKLDDHTKLSNEIIKILTKGERIENNILLR